MRCLPVAISKYPQSRARRPLVRTERSELDAKQPGAKRRASGTAAQSIPLWRSAADYAGERLV